VTWLPGLPYNTLVVAAGVAAVGFAAGVVGSLGVLRKRALVGDAAAHATLTGVTLAFLATGRRDLPVLLAGGLCSALVALGVLVLLRRWTRTREDAATAIVLGVSFGLGIALVSGITARGIPGGAGLEQFLLGHTAALTARDAALLAAVSAVAVVVVLLAAKEATLVAFDAAFAAATGWPVMLIDYVLVTLIAVMVVVGLPAAGAVLVTALVVIPPVAARQWTDRVGTMLTLSGCFGVVAALAGVAVSAVVPRLATGPLIVLAAAAIFIASFLAAPGRGWWSRLRRQRAVEQAWARGRILSAAAAGGAAPFSRHWIVDRVGGLGGGGRRRFDRAWGMLVRQSLIAPVGGSAAEGGHPGDDRWRLTTAGLEAAAERDRRMRAWSEIVEASPLDARALLTIDLPDPATDGAGVAARRAASEA
jgi:manganese/zinc/iron transport system permease protein